MGTIEYCSCFYKEPQGNETSLSRKPDTLIQNENYPEIDHHLNLDLITKSGNSIIDSSRQEKPKQFNRSSNMSSIETHHLASQNINYNNGDNYSGNIINNKREGKGKMTFASGGYYNGDFHDDYYEGYGTLCSKNTIYHGQFEKGEKKGKGKSENIKESTEFIGNWESNKKNGLGKEIYSDGTAFEGNFINGLKQGNGRITFSNGLKYSGDFNNDKIEGKGTFIWSDNKKYCGEWRDNSINGFGTLEQEKDIHIGYFNDEKKNGFGFNYFKHSKSFMLGKWVDNKIQGLAIYYIPDQSLKLWQMDKNKLVKDYKSNEEIDLIKASQEYNDIRDFYNNLRNNSLISYLNINIRFAL